MSCTLFLNPATWDFTLDTSGNIAVATAPWQLAQDVASACRLFLGELWYNTDLGVPYNTEILGEPLSIPFLSNALQSAAVTVPAVVSAKAVIIGIKGRTISGQVQFTTSDGSTGTTTI